MFSLIDAAYDVFIESTSDANLAFLENSEYSILRLQVTKSYFTTWWALQSASNSVASLTSTSLNWVPLVARFVWSRLCFNGGIVPDLLVREGLRKVAGSFQTTDKIQVKPNWRLESYWILKWPCKLKRSCRRHIISSEALALHAWIHNITSVSYEGTYVPVSSEW